MVKVHRAVLQHQDVKHVVRTRLTSCNYSGQSGRFYSATGDLLKVTCSKCVKLNETAIDKARLAQL